MKATFNLITIYKGILTSPKNYISFLYFSRWQLAIFYLVSCVLLSLIWSAKFVLYDLEKFRSYSQQASQEFVDYYPIDLQISWNQGTLDLNPSKQYSVYYPSFIEGASLNLPYRIADLVPNEVNNAELIDQHTNTLLVLSPSQLYVQQTEQEWQSIPLADLIDTDSFIITKTSLEQQVTASSINQNSFWQLLQVTSIVLAPFIVSSGLIWNGVVLVLLAYLLAIKLYQVKITGQQLVRLSIPILVVATFVQLLADLLYGTITIPLVSIAYWLLLLLVLRRISLKKTIHKSIKTQK